MKTFILAALLLCSCIISCTSPASKCEAQQQKIIPRDTSLNSTVSYSDFFIDSLTMEKFIAAQSKKDSLGFKLRNFYNKRNYQSAWFFKEGIAESATSFHEIYNDYIAYSGDSSLYNARLEKLYDTVITNNLPPENSLSIETELWLTTAFFQYATKAYQGNSQINTKELDWFIPRKRIDVAALLDSMLKNKGKNLSAYEPVNRQYNLLKEQLLKYYAIEKNGGWKTIAANKKSYKINDTAVALVSIKKKIMPYRRFIQ